MGSNLGYIRAQLRIIDTIDDMDAEEQNMVQIDHEHESAMLVAAMTSCLLQYPSPSRTYFSNWRAHRDVCPYGRCMRSPFTRYNLKINARDIFYKLAQDAHFDNVYQPQETFRNMARKNFVLRKRKANEGKRYKRSFIFGALFLRPKNLETN